MVAGADAVIFEGSIGIKVAGQILVKNVPIASQLEAAENIREKLSGVKIRRRFHRVDFARLQMNM